VSSGIASEIADLYEFLITHRGNTKPGKKIKSPSELSLSFEKIFGRISEASESNQEVKAAIESLEKLHNEDLMGDLSGEISDEEYEKIGKVLNCPEFLFFLKIKAPCVAFCMEYPSRLYRNDPALNC